MVQHLVQGMTSSLLTMPTVTLIPCQALVSLALFQVEYKAGAQSFPGLTGFTPDEVGVFCLD